MGWSKWLPAPLAWWRDIGHEGRAMLEEGEMVGYGRVQLAYLTENEVSAANGEVLTERNRMMAAMC